MYPIRFLPEKGKFNTEMWEKVEESAKQAQVGSCKEKIHFSMGSKDLNYAKRKGFSLPFRGEFVQCRLLGVSSKTWHISFEI